MTYRLVTQRDLPRFLHMMDQAEVSFRAKGTDQWQKGNPNGLGLAATIEQKITHVLEQGGQAVDTITTVLGPEASYARVGGTWLNREPYAAPHRVYVKKSCKGRGIAAQLFGRPEDLTRHIGLTNIRIDTHPDSRSIQRALVKSGYTSCGSLTLTEGAEKDDPRLAYHKAL